MPAMTDTRMSQTLGRMNPKGTTSLFQTQLSQVGSWTLSNSIRLGRSPQPDLHHPSTCLKTTESRLQQSDLEPHVCKVTTTTTTTDCYCLDWPRHKAHQQHAGGHEGPESCGALLQQREARRARCYGDSPRVAVERGWDARES